MLEKTTVETTIPKAMEEFAAVADEEKVLERNAMILYPYIRKSAISHGRAAEILGIHKTDLIAYYDRMGLPYLDQTEEELEEDLKNYYAAKRSENDDCI